MMRLFGVKMWKKFSEEKPENRKLVLISIDSEIATGYFYLFNQNDYAIEFTNNCDSCKVVEFDDFNEMINIIYWQSLPEPPNIVTVIDETGKWTYIAKAQPHDNCDCDPICSCHIQPPSIDKQPPTI